MAAVLILGLLSAAVVLTFKGPLRRARMVEAIEQVRYLDASGRDFARRFGRKVELVFDLSSSTLERREGGSDQPSFVAAIPSPFRIEAVWTKEQKTEYGEAPIALSPLGLSQTYAVRLAGPDASRWVVVTGLGGEFLTLANDAQVQAIFRATALRHDAD